MTDLRSPRVGSVRAGLELDREPGCVSSAALGNRVRKLGYAVSDEELEIGLRTIAVPVADSRGKVDLRWR